MSNRYFHNREWYPLRLAAFVTPRRVYIFDLWNTLQNHGRNGVSHYNCTFDPLAKLMEAIEKNEKLYEKLLKSEQEKVAMPERLLEGRKSS